MADIFVSYSSEDRERARVLAEALEKHGWSVWWDRKIPLGKSWDQVIEEQVDAARCIIVLWSATSIASTWVKTEAREGKSRGILIPALIDDVKIPLEFRHMQAANLSEWPVEAAGEFEMLVTHVADMLRVPGPLHVTAGDTGAARPGSAPVLMRTPETAGVGVDARPLGARPQRPTAAARTISRTTANASLLHTLGGPAPVCCLRFLPDGETLIALWQDHTARLWRIADGKPLGTFRGEGHAAWQVSHAAAFSPDGGLLATTPDASTVLLWRVSDGRLLHTLKGHTDVVNVVAFSADGFFVASGSADKTARVWDARDGSLTCTLKGHTQWICSLAFGPDGDLIASGTQVIVNLPELKVWRRSDGQVLHQLSGHGSTIHALAFSEDGMMLASGGSDNCVLTWHLIDGKLRHTLQKHTDAVVSVALSPDGGLVASASSDRTIGLWSSEDGQHLQTLQGHGARVSCVAFSADGTVLASGSHDHTVRLWTLE